LYADWITNGVMCKSAYSFAFLDQTVRYLWENALSIDDELEMSAFEFTICRIVTKILISDFLFGLNTKELGSKFISRMTLQATFVFCVLVKKEVGNLCKSCSNKMN